MINLYRLAQIAPTAPPKEVPTKPNKPVKPKKKPDKWNPPQKDPDGLPIEIPEPRNRSQRMQ